jgi:hypothetical protein
MRNPWVIIQLGLAAVLLVISLIGIVGTAAFDLPELAFSFAGGIQAFAIFPGLVLSLVLNALLMGLGRAPAPNTAQRVLLVAEFVLIGALVLFHFYTDPAGNTLGFAILTWPLVILLAVAIAVIALVRRPGRGAPPVLDPPASS